MVQQRNIEFMVEDARIIYLNFEGRGDKFNRDGERNFAVVLDEPTAQQMLEDGWNVKSRDPQDEGDEPFYYIQVKVSFKIKPPQIFTVTEITKVRTQLTESMVTTLDYADIANVDLICSSFDWEVNGKTGTTAYLKKMFVTLRQDALDLKYATASEAQEAYEGYGDDE